MISFPPRKNMEPQSMVGQTRTHLVDPNTLRISSYFMVFHHDFEYVLSHIIKHFGCNSKILKVKKARSVRSLTSAERLKCCQWSTKRCVLLWGQMTIDDPRSTEKAKKNNCDNGKLQGQSLRPKGWSLVTWCFFFVCWILLMILIHFQKPQNPLIQWKDTQNCSRAFKSC